MVQKEQTPMMDIAAPATPSAPKAVTTKHLAYMLAEQHHLSKKQSLEMMEELIGMITKHLKKGERVKIAGLGILQVRKRAARMGRNPRTGERSPSRPARRSPSARPRNSRWRSDCQVIAASSKNLAVCLGRKLCPATAQLSLLI
jgi:DNA-binding protein HU-beta